MKYIAIILFIMSFPTAAICNDAEQLSQMYLQAFSEEDFHKASELMHCPENYTSEEKNEDLKAVAESIAIFSEEFGTLESWEESSNNMYITTTTACGTVPYWEAHPISRTLIYSTKHQNGKPGYIVFNFSEINNKTVLAFANHGLPMGEQSISKIKQVLQRIANKMKASNK